MCALPCVVLGCQSKENPVLSNTRFSGEQYPSNALYSPEQNAQMVQVMQTTAKGMPVKPLTRAPDAVRWSDVPAAASDAIERAEMGLVSSTLDGDTWIFVIRTQGGGPATLTVTKKPAPAMFLATAKVGTFGERHVEAERVVREFRMAMRRYGALERPS
jgi:hypothetical protein